MTEYDSEIDVDNNEDSENSDNDSVTDVEDQDDNEQVDEADVDDNDSVVSDGDDVSDNEPADDDGEPKENVKSVSDKKAKKPVIIKYDDDDDDDSDDEKDYLQKFDIDVNTNYISEFHPECQIPNFDEIAKLAVVVRDEFNNIIDPLHRTIPFLTKYERARILGQRAKQIESGSEPFVNIPESVIDGHIIAEIELKQKRIPFIIRRPIPNGSFEYWHVRDLENISF
jgi:DNA-directed RNA polymerase subunit K/omega